MFIPPKSELNNLLFCSGTDIRLNQMIELGFGRSRQCYDPLLHEQGYVLKLTEDEAVLPPNYTGSVDAAITLIDDHQIPIAMEYAFEGTVETSMLRTHLASNIALYAFEHIASDAWQEQAHKDLKFIKGCVLDQSDPEYAQKNRTEVLRLLDWFDVDTNILAPYLVGSYVLSASIRHVITSVLSEMAMEALNNHLKSAK